MSEPESLFYFTNKYQENPGNNIWFKKSLLGKNEVREATFESCSKQLFP